MPELPDLQVLSRNLHKRFKGKIVEKVTVHRPKNLNVSKKGLEDALEGQKIRDFLLIHNTEKKESPNGASIQTQKEGSRETYFTDEQILYK